MAFALAGARRTPSPRVAPRSPTTTSARSRTSPGAWCSPTTPTPPARVRPRSGTQWEAEYDIELRVAALPAGQDPGRRGPGVARRASASPSRKPRRSSSSGSIGSSHAADLATPEGSGKAGQARRAIVAEHPNELVRDQYVMQLGHAARHRSRGDAQAVSAAASRRVSTRRHRRATRSASLRRRARSIRATQRRVPPRRRSIAASSTSCGGRSTSPRWWPTGSMPSCSPIRSARAASRAARGIGNVP